MEACVSQLKGRIQSLEEEVKRYVYFQVAYVHM